ncbi:hypothetical protein, partial [Metabacillus sp. 22489]|uniref:hypothetical protein n=1 Tax=Metabacillus sp. 22489 TaxID=3453928 RepID=UPI003F864848
SFFNASSYLLPVPLGIFDTPRYSLYSYYNNLCLLFSLASLLANTLLPINENPNRNTSSNDDSLNEKLLITLLTSLLN